MSNSNVSDELKLFLETSNVARLALGRLKVGVEIGIVLDDSLPLTVLRNADGLAVLPKESTNADFIFSLKSETAHELVKNAPEDVGQIGVTVFRKIVAGEIRARFVGKLRHLLTRGYFDVVASGGAPVASYLAKIGFSSIPGLINIVRKLRG